MNLNQQMRTSEPEPVSLNAKRQTNRAAPAPRSFAARALLHFAPGRIPAGIDWHTWWSRPSSKGLALSCLFHSLLCFALTFVVWAAHRPADEAEPLTAVFEPPGSRPVEFELSPVDSIGGGGGPTLAFEETAIASSQLTGGTNVELPFPSLPASETPIAGMNPGPGVGRGRGTGRGDGTGSRVPAGKNAVTEGSFTVWTIPDDPIPGETYTIMIEVRLPEKVARYSRNDLVGLVTGTDGWEQPLPGNAKPLQQYLPVHNHTVQLEVDVPGAGRRVKDTIQVRSKLLKEEQVLKIVF
jgi:hypothetical protein